MDLAVIGLGKLGAPLAAVLAAKGHRVIGVDRWDEPVAAINAGRAPVQEPGLQQAIDDAGGRLSATTDLAAAIRASALSFVIVPTPSGPDGHFSNDAVIAAVRGIGAALRGTSQRHVVNITSTVMPGSTGGPIRAALEEAAGRPVGAELGLTYNPEFIALGSVVRDLLHPDMLLIGEDDPAAGDVLEGVYRATLSPMPPVRRMGWANAELTKIAVNTFVTTKISYANMLAEICETLPGADVDVVTGALGMDSRIGRKYLTGALGYGGPCFPRDNVAMAAFARSRGLRADVAEATDTVNARQVGRIVSRVRAAAPAGAAVAVLGLAYKPATPVTECSQGAMIAHALADAGFRVTVCDPLAEAPPLPSATPEAAVAAADVVVVTTPDPAFAALPPALFARTPRRVVVDCWRVLPPQVAEVAQMIPLGRHTEPGPRP